MPFVLYPQLPRIFAYLLPMTIPRLLPRYFCLLLVLGCLLPTLAVAQAPDLETLLAYPSARKVANHFCNNYTYTPGKLTELTLQKRPDGWYVAFFDYEQDEDEPISWSRVWATETRDWVRLLDFAAGSTPRSLLGYTHPMLYDCRSTAIHAYFGYTGWEKDVIAALEGHEAELTDTLLYGLGRAYHHAGSELLPKPKLLHGVALTDARYKLPASKLGAFKTYYQKGFAAFRLLEQRNSDFETIVGRIGVKRANDEVDFWLKLANYHNKEAAREVLKPGIYDSFMLEMGKNYLKSCPPNAIVFTNGDNDTYPLLYVQQTAQFRTDVLVVNLSLLNLPEYRHWLESEALGAQRLQLYPVPGDLCQKPFQYHVVKSSYRPQPLAECISRAANPANFEVSNAGEPYPIWTATQLRVPVHKSDWINLGSLKPTEVEQLPDSITLNLSTKKRALLRSDFDVLRIVAQNLGRRPICFAITTGESAYMGIQTHFRNRGMVYELVPIAGSATVPYGTPDAEALAKNVRAFEVGELTPATANRQRMCMNYRNQFNLAAGQLLDAGRNEEAVQLLDRAMEQMPISQMPANYFLLGMAETYYKLEQRSKVRPLMLALLAELEKEEEKGIDLLGNPSRPQVITAVRYEIKRLATKYEDAALLEVLPE